MERPTARTVSLVLPLLSLSCGGIVLEQPGDAERESVGDAAASDVVQKADDEWDALEAEEPSRADASLEAANPDAPADVAADTPSDGGDGLPSTSMCLSGGNVLWLDVPAGSFWPKGTVLWNTSASQWAVGAQADTSKYDTALLEIHPPGKLSSPNWWYIAFDTSGLGMPLQTGVVYHGNADDLLAKVSMQIGRSQPSSRGPVTFRLDEFSATGDASTDRLVSITAAFTAQCHGHPGVLRGCVHFGP